MVKKRSSRGKPKPLKWKEMRNLREIAVLVERGQLEEAYDLLLTFVQRNPRAVEGWGFMLEVAFNLEDYFGVWYASRNLAQLEPNEPQHYYNLAMTTVSLAMPFSNYVYTKHYIDHWPDSPNIDDIRELHEAVIPICNALLDIDELSENNEIEYIAQYEAGQVLVSEGYFREGRDILQSVVKHLSQPEPALNNISLSYALEGDLKRALEISQQVLERDADNIHALCNSAQYLIRLGRDEEANFIFNRLRDTVPNSVDNVDLWEKMLETFAYIDEYETIIKLSEQAIEMYDELGVPDELRSDTLHFAATAHAHAGNVDKARELWGKALSANPSMTIARDNLTDSVLPLGQRNGAWYFPMYQWMPMKWAQQMAQVAEKGVKSSKEETFLREIKKLIKTLPELEVTFALMLKYGNRETREMILGIASVYPVPGLVEFALGKSGTDEHRRLALQFAAQHGQIESNKKVTVYIDGERTEIVTFGYQIHSDDKRIGISKKLADDYKQAIEAVYNAEIEAGEDAIAKALEKSPNHLVFMYFKSLIMAMTEADTTELEAYVNPMNEVHPDAFLARGMQVWKLIEDGELDNALEIIQEISQRSELHYLELDLLMALNINLADARDDESAVETWVEMWREIEQGMIPPFWAKILDI